MSPAVERGFIDEQQLERQLARQMGCMTGLLNIFDRQQMLTGKRIYSTRRLPSSPGTDSTSPSEVSEVSSLSALKESHPSPPDCVLEEVSARSLVPLPLPVFDMKDGLKPWKLREAPRLSLDSRAVVDAKGKLRPREVQTTVSIPSGKPSDTSAAEESERQRRSPSVVARLMGLDALPDSGGGGGKGGGGRMESNRVELRRSASESRVPRDPSYYRFVDSSSFEKTSPPISKPISAEEFFRRTNVADFKRMSEAKKTDQPLRTTSLPPLQRKSYFDAEDFFPEPKRSASLYVEIEKRLRRRGIDEPARDLEKLKQILEALQLKGLLHSKPSYHFTNARRNLIYDNDTLISRDSPIVVMKPAPKPPRRTISEPSPGLNRSSSSRRSSLLLQENLTPIRPGRSFDRSFVGGNDRRSRAPRPPESPQARRRPSSSPEPQRTPQPNRRISPVNSPRTSPKRVGQDRVSVRSPRIRQPVQDVSPKSRIYLPAEDDNAAAAISQSSISTNSQFDFERPRSNDYRSGRSLLERCDKLMSSIAAFTSGESISAADQQPSPVSVLDASPYLGSGVRSPSPSIKRSIDFKDNNRLVDWEEDQSEAATPTTAGSNESDDSTDVAEEIYDVDYAYVSRIVGATSNPRPYPPDEIFAVLEKRYYASDSSKAARLHRRLVFDTVAEILDRKRHLSPWEAFACARSFSAVAGGGSASLPLIWTEVGRIKEQVPTDDLNDVTCGVIRKDMAGDHLDGGEWGPQPAAELSDAVLQIERQIFKDLIAEAIRGLADISVKSRPHISRRKLMF